jgi:hypothetical protein
MYHLVIFDGVSDFNFDDVWSGGSNLEDGITWRWSDGKPFEYRRWKPGTT